MVKIKKIVIGIVYTLGFIGIPFALGSWLFTVEPFFIKWILGVIASCVLAVVWLIFYAGLEAVLDKIK